MFAEHGPIECLQIGAWIIAFACALSIALRRSPPRERVFGAWLCLVALLAALRELDAHAVLNPGALGDFGVRYRADWWLDSATPVLPRVLWLLVGAGLVCALVAPFVWVAPKFVKLLAVRDGAWLLFALAATALITGYACDDLFGRGQFVDAAYSKAAEEVAELCGSVAFVAGVWLLRRRALGVREARADRLLESTPLAALGRRRRRGSELPPPPGGQHRRAGTDDAAPAPPGSAGLE